MKEYLKLKTQTFLNEEEKIVTLLYTCEVFNHSQLIDQQTRDKFKGLLIHFT